MNRGDTCHQLSAAELLDGLGTRRVGQEVIVLPEVNSTNSFALDALAVEQGAAADGWVVFAEHQTVGRGRLGRSWHSPRGAGLLFTVLLCSGPARPTPARSVMAAAVAVAAGTERATLVAPVIRWPNDIHAGGKKLGGILVEVRPLTDSLWATAVGIGVNCLQHEAHFPPELRGRATSLDLESSHPVDRTAVAQAILRELDVLWSAERGVSDDDLAAAWKAHSADLGARVTLTAEGRTFTGCIADVHPQTGLLLQLDTGARREFDPSKTTRL